MKKLTNDLVIVGGGAAGMFAAAQAVKRGLRVLLLEKNDRLGKKLAITGKGRCNVTNHCTPEEVLKNVPRNPRFLYSAMFGFPPERAMAFFEEHGCPLKTERGNRVFPVSDRSADVIAALERAMRSPLLERRQETVLGLFSQDGRVTGVKTQKGIVSCDNILLCTGGASYPLTGSTGDGFRLANGVGHNIIAPTGSLVPLVSDSDCVKMQGLSLRNTELKLLDEKGKCVFKEFGELLFTHFGISGPMALSASAHMKSGETYTISLDLKPALDEAKLDARFLRDFEKYANRSMENALADLYPHSMIPILLERCGIDSAMQANALTKQQRRSLLEQTKRFLIPISGTRPVDEAIITRGGVDVKQIDPKTMQSKLIEGLYFAGEIIDCDAYTGGFNLQIAWATAFAAVNAIAESRFDKYSD
ncbi:MAG: NAD(P)/FAD-dependent oxidoreductase [Oscillospiraceae bacterium]|nr:NAD(P)/FAD-dependent oxidoreductase [Oscillospiraceae bacterium]